VAKVGAPLDPSTLPPGAANVFYTIIIDGKSYRRQQTPKHGTMSENLQAMRDLHRQAGRAWSALDRWKRGRWSSCAIARGSNGPALYISEYIRQQIDQGFQPISPCSRRMTDPSSSPYDFTP
jgi:hypothetical protein